MKETVYYLKNDSLKSYNFIANIIKNYGGVASLSILKNNPEKILGLLIVPERFGKTNYCFFAAQYPFEVLYTSNPLIFDYRECNLKQAKALVLKFMLYK